MRRVTGPEINPRHDAELLNSTSLRDVTYWNWAGCRRLPDEFAEKGVMGLVPNRRMGT
jgi:hypothetical protein